jgi:hypothetical protein
MKKPELDVLEKNIHAALEKVGLKRANAADRLGVDRAWFYRMLSSGNWKMDVLLSLADLLGVPVWWLFFDRSKAEDIGTEVPDAPSLKKLAKDILVLPGGEHPLLVNLKEYIEVPIIKLQSEMDPPGAGTDQESLGNMFVRKDIVAEISGEKIPYATELKLRIKMKG